MNRRTFLYAAIFGSGAVVGALPGRRPFTASTSKFATRPKTPAPAIRALSLSRYQSSLALAFQSGTLLPPDLATLRGINQIGGFLLEPENEVVVFGSHDPALPPIELDDLLIGLRSAYRASAEYSTAPGCTIDPMPDVADPWKIQIARVLGMAEDAPMGSRHLEVDYQLKKLSAGLVKLAGSGAGLRGVFELTRSERPPCSASDGGGQSATHRFWFCPSYPQERRYLQDDQGVLILRPINVQVMTEEEFLQNGRRIGAAGPGKAAADFAASITQLLATNDVPAYSRLRNDFRVIEASKLIQYKKAPSEALDFLLKHCPMGRVETPKHVGGIRREESGEAVCDAIIEEQHKGGAVRTVSSARLSRYRHEYRGGVEVSVDIAQGAFSTGTEELEKLRHRIRRGRPSASSISWDS